jgi:hypothetical protein
MHPGMLQAQIIPAISNFAVSKPITDYRLPLTAYLLPLAFQYSRFIFFYSLQQTIPLSERF